MSVGTGEVVFLRSNYGYIQRRSKVASGYWYLLCYVKGLTWRTGNNAIREKQRQIIVARTAKTVRSFRRWSLT